MDISNSNSSKKLKKSHLKIPVLVMYSSTSAKNSKYSEKAKHKDIVLNINDIKRIEKN